MSPVQPSGKKIGESGEGREEGERGEEKMKSLDKRWTEELVEESADFPKKGIGESFMRP